ncbi:pumilio-family RNA binding repeat protein [Aspergillus sclerotioniger CBS 115572]|uniref:Pumilio-family RNA binding repeat protein n=1 Tax=Aspergillus sclerotioniger CBS 115572 TaxID=1450535 RepID=A0A317WJT6_9EURO|nr:pumilio-family RNA binding repeat protein [Aspergillus sclerotioniger CBS 115572]PWY86325.1 pumilio-family RNA binding repeat protein [Aspergillus sclerotioniger CBS 115572]
MSLLSDGSPKFGRKQSEGDIIDSCGSTMTHALHLEREASGHKHSNITNSPPDRTIPFKIGNTQASDGDRHDIPSNKKQKLEHSNYVSLTGHSEMEKLLAKLSPKPQSSATKLPVEQDIITRLSEKQILLKTQNHAFVKHRMLPGGDTELSVASSILPARDAHQVSQLTDIDKSDTASIDISEVLRLKQELLAANSKIALQEQELAQTRVIKHTLDQALGPPSETDFNGREITEQTISNLQSALNSSNQTFSQFQDGWNAQDDSQSDMSDALSAGAYNRARGYWIPPTQQVCSTSISASATERPYGEPLSLPNNNPFGGDSNKFWGNSDTNPSIPGHDIFRSHRVFSGPSQGAYTFDTRLPEEQARYLQGPGLGPRRSVTQAGRSGSCFPTQSPAWSTLTPGSSDSHGPRSPANRSNNTYQQVGLYPIPQYHQRPVGTPLSPTATEFTAPNTNTAPWPNSSVGGTTNQTYISPLEPINYRRLLDRNVSCDWKYIVDKIVCNNDQQASIFLQQKLKVGTTEQKYDIIEAIVHQAYPLMVNRFGNFLVQRCFEHGTPEQVVSIANAIKGNTLSLSMDPFGCHVIQKAFDCVPEEHKAVMVHELLRRIPETVIHRYACHVWQKLFELRWSGEPPQIMTKVNEALRGMWHEVALGETGSLVVQNIFENCVEDEKRPAIEEVLAKIDVLAHGQFGNWCIQHICEHGAPQDKSRAVEHIILWSVDYSMDQFASKIVEKCLKIGGSEFLDRFLARVCTGRTDRPRMPLIDIAGDQYGNYLIQWILMNAAPHQRELVASHIRKHMVSLRGSKFGSRVAMLCCNPSHATRPGPGSGMPIGRYNNFNDDRFPIAGQHGGRFSRGSQWNPSYPPFR